MFNKLTEYVKFCDSCKAEMAIKPSALIGAENSLDLEEISLLEEREELNINAAHKTFLKKLK